MKQYYLAVDIGASSGRHILGHMENGKMHLEEIYRFENGMVNQGGKLLWNLEGLFQEIINGMKRCAATGKIPKSMSIDTWAVDYVLLDEEDRILGECYGYRDGRTRGMDRAVYEIISERELYDRTGIQKQIFNTIYQLMAVKQQEPELLKRAETFLMLPDYFQFLLTGKKQSEYTNGTTTQLVNPETKQWDKELMELLGYPRGIFLPLQMPGTRIGRLKEEIQKQVGFQCEVVHCASHDTASAVMAMPVAEEKGIYISSGTWSLMGIESGHALISQEGQSANFTNEGGYDYRFRYLKNIMGLWMIQSVKHELKEVFSFAELCEMAEECRKFPSYVNVNDDCFLAPDSMIKAVQNKCRASGQRVPESAGELSAVIYQSLARCYEEVVREIEQTVGEEFERIYIIGGGSNASYLNQLTANAAKKIVYAGPVEATAMGNVIAQMIWAGELKDLEEARSCVHQSFDIKKYIPE